jgi:hypothetical protein
VGFGSLALYSIIAAAMRGAVGEIRFRARKVGSRIAKF